MEWSAAGLGSSFALGFAYFLAAIPAGAALGLSVPLAASAAWLGYTCGAAVVALPGAALREWLSRKFRWNLSGKSHGWISAVWERFGIWGLGLVAPVTVGPQLGTLLAVSLGIRPVLAVAAFSVGVIPWSIGFGILTFFGTRLVD
ncbi:MAG: small multi-drug export protein [Terrimicrobiaceae bacterium]|nr:small multi-drug export protein [Terrimicrobiaceae bacterium]